jgi:hypothetical protein
MDTLFKVARNNFDPESQFKAPQRARKKCVSEALFRFVAHDVGPRAMSPRSGVSCKRKTHYRRPQHDGQRVEQTFDGVNQQGCFDDGSEGSAVASNRQAWCSRISFVF